MDDFLRCGSQQALLLHLPNQYREDALMFSLIDCAVVNRIANDPSEVF